MKASLSFIALAFAFGSVSAACVAQQAQPSQVVGAPAAAEASAVKVRQEIIASWIVEVSGESRTRTLIVRGAEQGSEGAWNLDAVYGFSDGNQSAVKAQLVVLADGFRLEFTTQPGTLVVAEGTGAGVFTGTFTPKGGRAKPVRLVRSSDEDVRLRAAQFKALMAKPGTDVPESCARYFGGWTGKWPGDPVPVRLWIVGIKADCTAQVSYRSTSSSEVPESFVAATIGPAGFGRPCGGDGNCQFELRGEEIWVTYTHMAYATKSAALQKFR
jgi:hypothetical protein